MSARLTAIAAIIALSTATAHAAEQLVEVDSFSGISIGSGLKTKVTCGSSNTITLRGKQKELNKIDVAIDQDILDISRNVSAGSIIGKLLSSGDSENTQVELDIEMTDGMLSVIDISSGATIKVDSCAVNSSKVIVDASSGSYVEVNGFTADLELDMSTGSAFNRSATSFTVENAHVDLSSGATANLCGATNIHGDAGSGAVIYASKEVNTADLDLSFGADTSSKRCK